MDPGNLAAKLAAAINEVVPSGFRVFAEQGMVFIKGGSYRAASEVAEVLDAAGNICELAAAVSTDALAMVQEYVVDEGRSPWPGSRPCQPTVNISKDTIQLSYRDEQQHIVLELPSVSW